MVHQETLRNFVFEKLKKNLELFCKKRNISFNSKRLHLEYSRNEKFGNYSSAFFLENKKKFKADAFDLVNQFVKTFSEDSFLEVTASEPAFINFRVNELWFIQYLDKFILRDDFIPKVEKPEKINLEYISANPTGPLNIVSARTAANGNAIANLLRSIGHQVITEYYVNDHGKQVFLLGVSVLVRIREILGEEVLIEDEKQFFSIKDILKNNVLPKDGYQGDYLKEVSSQIYLENRDNIGRSLEKKDYLNLIDFLSKTVIKKFLISQKQVLKDFSITFDKFFFESSLHPDAVIQTIEDLKNKEKIYQKEQKLFFKSTLDGDDKDRVVVRENGEPTYFLSDIAYHRDKLKRNFDRVIDIFGPDHHGYVPRIKSAVKAFSSKEQKFDVITIQQVTLKEKGEKQKMSKRKGVFKTMQELLTNLSERNSQDVAKYFFLMTSYKLPLEFDLELALDISDKNPVFYVQYAYARICSIFREFGQEYDIKKLQELQMTETRTKLLFCITRSSDEIFDAAKSLEPHKMTNYLQDLCKAFTHFYVDKKNQIKDTDKNTRLGLNVILLGTKIVLEKSLNLLGVSAPEQLYKNAN